jgi:hypothetical protein|tara:strand:+ start:3400 stop:3645 length:246 start_codon:yes stop_codon:yes gene_type:complete
MKEQNCEDRVIEIFGEEVEKGSIENPVLRKILNTKRMDSFLFRYKDSHTDHTERYSDHSEYDEHSDRFYADDHIHSDTGDY